MASFNFKQYLSKMAAKEEAASPISKQLEENHSSGKQAEKPVEKNLDGYRSDTKDTPIEKTLDKSRDGKDQHKSIEALLDTSKSKLVTHRNTEAHTGNINKLDEQRIKAEKERAKKAEPASKSQADVDFMKSKSEDGLKLASGKNKIVVADRGDDGEDFTFNDDGDELEEDIFGEHASFEAPSRKRSLDDDFPLQDEDDEEGGDIGGDLPPEQKDLSESDIDNMLKEFGVELPETEESEEVKEEALQDMNVLEGIFARSKRTIDAGGTKMSANTIRFDPEDEVLVDTFGVNGKVPRETLIQKILDFANQDNPGQPVTRKMLDLSKMKDGIVSFMTPVMAAPSPAPVEPEEVEEIEAEEPEPVEEPMAPESATPSVPPEIVPEPESDDNFTIEEVQKADEVADPDLTIQPNNTGKLLQDDAEPPPASITPPVESIEPETAPEPTQTTVPEPIPTVPEPVAPAAKPGYIPPVAINTKGTPDPVVPKQFAPIRRRWDGTKFVNI